MMAEDATIEISEAEAAGASFHGVTDWYAIYWRSVNQNVRRLQARIVKATKEGRWGPSNVGFPTRLAAKPRPGNE